VLETLQPDMQGRKIVWQVESLPEAEGDQTLLKLVLSNLISNALKYTRTRGESRIAIGSTNNDQGEIVYFIRDNGVGFDMQYADKLFRRLSTAAHGRRVRGHRHRSGHSSTNYSSPRRFGLGRRRGGRRRNILFFITGSSGRNLEMTVEARPILLVEDDRKDAELTLAAFAEGNISNEMIVVRDGVEALDYLFRRGKYAARAEGTPVVILLDLKLPKVDGIQVLQTLKADPVLKSVPVVMLTSSREESDVIRSYNLGVNAYVVKPVDFHEFTDAIKELGLFWTVVNQPPRISSQVRND
jgi:CheY-like chemotaxis protein